MNASSRLRLLVLLPFPPRRDGFHGSSRTTGELLMRLASRHDVGLLYFRAQGEPPVEDSLAHACVFSTEVMRDSAKMSAAWAFRAKLLAGLAHGRPMWATRLWSVEYARRASELVRDWRPEVVQLDFHVMAQYLASLDPCPAPRLLVEHEPGILAARELAGRRRGLRAIVPWLDVRAWERFERSAFEQVDAVVAVTERDRHTIQRLSSAAPVEVITPGMPIPHAPLDPHGTSPPSLVFIGNFAHWPNVEAATRLATSIFPAVRAIQPDVSLQIVGAEPPQSLIRLTGHGVEVTGGVPDVTPYLDRASVVIVPIRSGGGVRIKIMEALAAGKAVVTSPLGADGLAVTSGLHLLIAEEDEQFVQSVLALLRSPEDRVSMARAARDWASTQLDWDKTVRGYEQLYGTILQTASQRKMIAGA